MKPSVQLLAGVAISGALLATGRTVLDLKSLASSGSVSGRVRDVLIVEEDGQEDSALVDEAFEVQVRAGL